MEEAAGGCSLRSGRRGGLGERLRGLAQCSPAGKCGGWGGDP